MFDIPVQTSAPGNNASPRNGATGTTASSSGREERKRGAALRKKRSAERRRRGGMRKSVPRQKGVLLQSTLTKEIDGRKGRRASWPAQGGVSEHPSCSGKQDAVGRGRKRSGVGCGSHAQRRGVESSGRMATMEASVLAADSEIWRAERFWLRVTPLSSFSFSERSMAAEKREAKRSAPGDAPGRDVVAIPVVDGERFNAHAGPGLGTVNETVLTDVDARVIAGARNAENHDVAGAQTAAGNAFAHAGLIAADAGHGNAVACAGPVHEAGAVEAAGGRGSAGYVGTAELAFGRGGDGRTAAGSGARLLIGRSVGLFAAASGHEKGHAQKNQRNIPIEGMIAMCRHDGPAGVESAIFLL